MKKLPQELEKNIANYFKGLCSYSYLQEKITDYIEKKNLKNETMKINMVMNDARTGKTMLENWNIEQAQNMLDFIKHTLLFIK